jgi:hypothetical protein
LLFVAEEERRLRQRRGHFIAWRGIMSLHWIPTWVTPADNFKVLRRFWLSWLKGPRLTRHSLFKISSAVFLPIVDDRYFPD